MLLIRAVLLVYMIVVNFNRLIDFASMSIYEDDVRGFLIEKVVECVFIGWPELNVM